MDTSFLTFIAVNGLAAGGLAAILRALPWPAAWRAKKPLGCALCMGFWSALAVLAASVAPSWVFVLQLLAITGVASWINAQVIPPHIELPGAETPPEGP